MSVLPIENLELQALEQRNQLHKRASELRSKLSATREKLRLDKNAREHFVKASTIATLIGFISGYSVASLFTSD